MNESFGSVRLKGDPLVASAVLDERTANSKIQIVKIDALGQVMQAGHEALKRRRNDDMRTIRDTMSFDVFQVHDGAHGFKCIGKQKAREWISVWSVRCVRLVKQSLGGHKQTDVAIVPNSLDDSCVVLSSD